MPNITEDRVVAVIEDPSGTTLSVELYAPDADIFMLRLSGHRISETIRDTATRRTTTTMSFSFYDLRQLIADLDKIINSYKFQQALVPTSRTRNFEYTTYSWPYFHIGFKRLQFYIGYDNTVGTRRLILGDPVQTLNDLKEVFQELRDDQR